ncbi:HEAT repeat domain-containing protein [Geminocystis herdmanii]|uniref:HEAT repeat domain-containing protein n=1 Tax=Geminocystis herdmanii TaxID=669359 RepID=UPI0003634BCB|nr:HEAT repeat domain-containing protein [Geminocystis herdmanii]
MSNNSFPSETFLPNVLNLTPEERESIPLELALKVLELGSFEEKWIISKVLVKYGEAVIPPLKKIILDENVDTESRGYGLKILSQIQHPEIILIVTELLSKTQEEELITIATETLVSQGKQSITFLSQLLINPDSRLLATKALTQIPRKDVIPLLLSLVNDDDTTIRSISISALGNFDTPEIKIALINALKDYASSVRKEAVTALGLKLKSTEDVELINLITPLLEDIDLSVAQQTAISLSRCHHPIVIQSLEKVLYSSYTPQPLKITIVKALGWIDTLESIQCLGKAIHSFDTSITLPIINILGRITKPSLKSPAVTILTNFYYSQSSTLDYTEILQALCYSLKQLGSMDGIFILQDIVTHHNPQVSLYAQSALEELQNL